MGEGDRREEAECAHHFFGCQPCFSPMNDRKSCFTRGVDPFSFLLLALLMICRVHSQRLMAIERAPHFPAENGTYLCHARAANAMGGATDPFAIFCADKFFAIAAEHCDRLCGIHIFTL